MKKILLLIISIFLLGFVACSKTSSKQVSNTDLNKIVAQELESIDKNYSDETLKALSVILRTNILIYNKQLNKEPNQKYLNLANQTNNKVLKNEKNNLIEISLDNNNEYTWQKSIKKSKLLEFALKNKINLTNLSNIEPIKDDNKVEGINIGNKYFDYKELANEFGLESNEIETIEENKKEIVIKGKNKGFYGNFDTLKSEQLSNDNYSYENILKTFFKDLKII